MVDITVILDRKELVVRTESSALRIDRPGTRPERIPLNMVERVIVVGNPMISCGVWRELAERNIPAVLLPARGKGATAYMGSGLSDNVSRRIAQYSTLSDSERALDISRQLLLRKLEGQETVIKDICGDALAQNFCEAFETCGRDIQTAGCRDAMMGYEGAAAAAYFKALSELIPEKWNFSGRNRRPPRDPVNALLSLSYVIAGNEVLRVIRAKGLDPTIGFLHAPKSGRDSLMLDILEPLRPLTDSFVLRLLDTVLFPGDFRASEKDGCRLTKSGRRAYYDAWSHWVGKKEDNRGLIPTAKAIVRKLTDFIEASENITGTQKNDAVAINTPKGKKEVVNRNS